MFAIKYVQYKDGSVVADPKNPSLPSVQFISELKLTIDTSLQAKLRGEGWRARGVSGAYDGTKVSDASKEAELLRWANEVGVTLTDISFRDGINKKGEKFRSINATFGVKTSAVAVALAQ